MTSLAGSGAVIGTIYEMATWNVSQTPPLGIPSPTTFVLLIGGVIVMTVIGILIQKRLTKALHNRFMPADGKKKPRQPQPRLTKV